MPEQWNPRPYQKTAIQTMITRGAAGLFLDPGLGKTSITLAAYKILFNQGYVRRMLVVAPLRVCQLVWPAEVKKWANFHGLKVNVLHGKDKDKLAREEAHIYVINPEGLWSANKSWYFDYAHKYVQPDMLVIDESTRFKNTKSKRFKVLKKHIADFRRRYILTGTPAPKGYEDLFGQIYILDQGTALGEYITKFRREHFVPVDGSGHIVYKWALKEGHDQIIMDRLAPFCLRMRAQDYLDLPELVQNDVWVDLPDNVRGHYQELENEFFTVIEDEAIEAPSAAAVSNKVRQLCNGGLYTAEGDYVTVHDIKCQALADTMEEAGSPMFVLTQYQHDVKRIRDFMGYEVPYLGGGTSSNDAVKHVTSFNRGELPLLLAHPASAGHGLNLQEVCCHVGMFGLPWDLELYDQALKRVLRSGNPNKRVFLHRYLALNTIEVGMAAALVSKDRSQQALLNYILEYRRNQNGEPRRSS